MKTRRAVLSATLVLIALVLQSSFLGRLGLPGATPDLVLVVVVALSLAYGPGVGGVTGFIAGLLVDMAPPADGVVGLTALIGLAVGTITGAAIDPRDRTIVSISGMVGASTGGAVIVYAAMSSIVGGGRVDWSLVPGLALSAGLYGVLLGMAVVPFVTWAARRMTPDLVL